MKIEKVAIVGRGALGILYGAHFTEKLGKQAVSFVAGEDRIERYMSSQPVCNGRACDFSYISEKKRRKSGRSCHIRSQIYKA